MISHARIQVCIHYSYMQIFESYKYTCECQQPQHSSCVHVNFLCTKLKACHLLIVLIGQKLSTSAALLHTCTCTMYMYMYMYMYMFYLPLPQCWSGVAEAILSNHGAHNYIYVHVHCTVTLIMKQLPLSY